MRETAIDVLSLPLAAKRLQLDHDPCSHELPGQFWPCRVGLSDLEEIS